MGEYISKHGYNPKKKNVEFDPLKEKLNKNKIVNGQIVQWKDDESQLRFAQVIDSLPQYRNGALMELLLRLN